MAFTILEVHHTGLTVRDIEASLAFWRDVMGFAVLYRATRTGAFAAEVTGVPRAEIAIAVLQAPGHRIELLEYRAPGDRAHLRPRPCDIGSLHLAFDVDDLNAALAVIAARGWTVAGAPQVVESGTRAGTRVVYLHDPDGTTIELMQPPRTTEPRDRAAPLRA